jgi:hypothetical protein
MGARRRLGNAALAPDSDPERLFGQETETGILRLPGDECDVLCEAVGLYGTAAQAFRLAAVDGLAVSAICGSLGLREGQVEVLLAEAEEAFQLFGAQAASEDRARLILRLQANRRPSCVSRDPGAIHEYEETPEPFRLRGPRLTADAYRAALFRPWNWRTDGKAG